MRDWKSGKHTMIDVALGLFSLGAFCLSTIMFLDDRTISSPGAFPLGVSALMIILASSIIIKNKRDKTQKIFDIRVLSILLTLSVYVALTQLIGFYPSTVVFAASSVIILGEKPALRVFLYSAGLVLVLWVLFGTIFKVTLP
jgi:hypothetical protein